MQTPPLLSASSIAPPPRRPRTKTWLVLLAGAVAVIAAGICIPVARAVERPARYEITLLFPGHAYDEVRRTHMVLSVDGKPLEYESRESCRIAITRVKVELKGVRLQCNPVEALRVWR